MCGSALSSSDLEVCGLELQSSAGFHRLVDLEHRHGGLIADFGRAVEFVPSPHRTEEIFQVRLVILLTHLHGQSVTGRRKGLANVQYRAGRRSRLSGFPGTRRNG